MYVSTLSYFHRIFLIFSLWYIESNILCPYYTILPFNLQTSGVTVPCSIFMIHWLYVISFFVFRFVSDLPNWVGTFFSLLMVNLDSSLKHIRKGGLPSLPSLEIPRAELIYFYVYVSYYSWFNIINDGIK